MTNALIPVGKDNDTTYISKKVETKVDKISIYNALNNPDENVADNINMKIELVDVLLEQIEMVNDEDDGIEVVSETGEIVEEEPETTVAVRTVLIDKDGKSYQAVSKGVYNSIKQIINIFGEPSTWEDALTVEVKQVKVKRGSMLTLNILG